MLQSLVRDAAAKPQPFEFIVVLNFNRNFRIFMESELYRAKFERLNIRLVSVQQDFADDNAGRLVRQVLGAIDDFALNTNAQQVSQMMLANARTGYWYGSSAPSGYQTRGAVRLGNKDKKVLAINDAEAPVVERIFRLHHRGEDGGRSMGLKAICTPLNRERVAFRNKPILNSSVADNLYRGRGQSLREEICMFEAQDAGPARRVTTAVIEMFVGMTRKALRGPGHGLRQDYVRLLISSVTLSAACIDIRGSTQALEVAVAARNGSDGEVLTFERKWCARNDSNVRPSDS